MSGPVFRRIAVAVAGLIAAIAALFFRRGTGQPSAARRTPVEVDPPVALRGFGLEDTPSIRRPGRRTSGLRSLAPIAAVLAIGFAGYVGWHEMRRERQRMSFAAAVAGGDPSKAPELMRRYGCAGCHEIRGVAGPGGRIGPPLTNVGQRVYLAGMLANTPDNLVRWIMDPKGVNPRTAMPVTGISEQEARDVAAYLLGSASRSQ